LLSGNWSKWGHAVREFVRNMMLLRYLQYISDIAKHIELKVVILLHLVLVRHAEAIYILSLPYL